MLVVAKLPHLHKLTVKLIISLLPWLPPWYFVSVAPVAFLNSFRCMRPIIVGITFKAKLNEQPHLHATIGSNYVCPT